MDLNLPPTEELSVNHSEISNQGESEKKKPCIFSLGTLELLKKYGSECKRLKGKKLCEPRCSTVWSETSAPALSTEEVMKVARARFIKYFSCISDDLANHPNDYAHCNLSYEDNNYVELAQLLLASAEKVSNQEYDQARELLNACNILSSITGNPVQRVVYYFVEALQERIDRETGRIAPRELKDVERYQLNVEEAMNTPNPTMLACLKELPFNQPTQFTGIQAIVENVSKAKRVHVIDLEIATGVQWTILMQALVAQYECSLQLLKITAVGTAISKMRIQEIGKRLTYFAETINLPFSFKMVMVSDFKDLKKDAFELEDDEVLVVYHV